MSKLAQVRGLLFDKDGTLLDYWKTWVPINRMVADYAARGEPQLRDAVLRAGGHDPVTDHVVPGSVLAGGTVDEIADMARFAVGIANAPADLDAAVARLFREGGAQHAVMIEGARGALVRLKASGFKLGLATNDTEAGMAASLQAFEVLDLFDFACGADSGHGAKPGAGMVLGFCHALGLRPEAVAVIGDSIHDLEMAHRAGAAGIAVLSGTSGRDDLAPHADLVLNSVRDLPDALSIA
jgi:phosphoglycolate phosphatase